MALGPAAAMVRACRSSSYLPTPRSIMSARPLRAQPLISRHLEAPWLGGARISEPSFARPSGPLLDLFDFSRPVSRTLILDPTTGLPVAPSKDSQEDESRAPGAPSPPTTR